MAGIHHQGPLGYIRHATESCDVAWTGLQLEILVPHPLTAEIPEVGRHAQAFLSYKSKSHRV